MVDIQRDGGSPERSPAKAYGRAAADCDHELDGPGDGFPRTPLAERAANTAGLRGAAKRWDQSRS